MYEIHVYVKDQLSRANPNDYSYEGAYFLSSNKIDDFEHCLILAIISRRILEMVF
mgnify:CR=1 FL=1